MSATVRRRIAVATADALGERMAGPAIRAWHIASALAPEHDVQLFTTATATRSAPHFRVTGGGNRELRELVEWCDVLVFQGWIMVGRPFIAESDRVLVADVYDPMHLEQLEQGREAGDDAGRLAAVAGATAALNEQLLRGDYFLCASEKQRDFWLGHLASLGRVNPRTYDADKSLRNLLTIVPFGIEDEPPVRTGRGAKGVIDGIGATDVLLLWAGGIYNWFDPLNLIRAVDLVRATHPKVRLLFMGGRHPNPEIPEMQMAVAARALAADLGLLGAHVFFNDDWVPYDERQNFLLDADIGVSTHHDHVETAFSFRTRMLDYLWAGVPVVATAGDAIGAFVDEHGLGLTVPPDDPAAIAAAIGRLLDEPDLVQRCRHNIVEAAPGLRWSSALAPLVAFCRTPARAPDLIDPQLGPALARERSTAGPPPSTGLRHDLALIGRHLRAGGIRLLITRLRSRVARLARARRSARGA